MAQAVTAADVERIASTGERRMVVAEGDVVTPSAVDEARARGIAIEGGGGRQAVALATAVGSAGGATTDAIVGALGERVSREVASVLEQEPGAPVERLVELALQRLAASDFQAGALETVTQRMAAWVLDSARRGVPDRVVHEGKRLLLNNLKASVGARNHRGVEAVRQILEPLGDAGRPARVLWHGTTTASEQAAVINAVQMEVLDFNETYVPTYVHTAAAVAPAVLAEAEALRSTGKEMLTAMTLGIEIELTSSEILMPSHYRRGFNPTGVNGSLGAVAGVAALHGLSHHEATMALGIGATSAAGLFEAIGTMGWPYSAANAARTGVLACRMAALGVESPPTAYDGEQGMFVAYSDEDPAKIDGLLDSLGSAWRVLRAGYKRYQAETIDQAPLQCTLTIRDRVGERRVDQVDRLRFTLNDLVTYIAYQRYERFGKPNTDLEATFDLRYVMASAWKTGMTGNAAYREEHYRDPAILDLRDRVEITPDADVPIPAAKLDVVFKDGSTESVAIDAWKGAEDDPMSDDELSDLFRRTAEAAGVQRTRIDAVLDAVWHAEQFDDVRDLARELRG